MSVTLNTPAAPPPRPETKLTPAQTAVRGRLITIVSGNAGRAAKAVDPESGALALVGASPEPTARAISNAFPNVTLIVEPDSAKVPATPTEPWVVPALEDDGLFERNILTEILDGQRTNGATVAVTPTGYIGAEEYDTLRAVVAAANKIDRHDVLVLLPLHPSWLVKGLKLLISEIGKLRHPALIAFADTHRPVDNMHKRRGYRKLFASCAWAIPWRTDLAGLDAFAHGAAGVGIGMLPSQRRAPLPGRGGFSGMPEDRTPNVLVPELLGYVKASKLKRAFVASPAPHCGCPACEGQSIDRFGSSEDDQSASACTR